MVAVDGAAGSARRVIDPEPPCGSHVNGMEVKVTFCGYHPAMSAGLSEFGEGVATSTLQKAQAAGRSIDAHIEVELVQLDALIDELEAVETRTDNQESLARARVLKGLAIVCQACFSSARGIHNTESFQEHFATQFALYGDVVKELEDAYEGCPPGTSIKERTRVGVKAAITNRE